MLKPFVWFGNFFYTILIQPFFELKTSHIKKISVSITCTQSKDIFYSYWVFLMSPVYSNYKVIRWQQSWQWAKRAEFCEGCASIAGSFELNWGWDNSMAVCVSAFTDMKASIVSGAGANPYIPQKTHDQISNISDVTCGCFKLKIFRISAAFVFYRETWRQIWCKQQKCLCVLNSFKLVAINTACSLSGLLGWYFS